jgi:hypothetical protein
LRPFRDMADSADISSSNGAIILLFHQDVRQGTYKRLLRRGEGLSSTWADDQLLASTPGTPSSPGVVRLETARFLYDRMAALSTKSALSFEEVIAPGSLSETLEKTGKYLHRLLATKEESPEGHLFANGKYIPMAGVSFLFVPTRPLLMSSYGQQRCRGNWVHSSLSYRKR